jgi:uncharacterized membrane protein
MLRGLSIQAAPLAMLGVLWPPFCDLPEWPGGGGGNGGAPGGGAPSGGVAGAAAGEGGDGGSGGAVPEAGDPVLGCAGGKWRSSQARLEILSDIPFEDGRGGAQLWKLSADGEVVLADYVVDEDPASGPEGHRPIVWKDRAWHQLDSETLGIPTAINCDGTVIAGQATSVDAFIERAGAPPLILPGKAPTWAAIPSDLSADGARVLGNYTTIERGPDAGKTVPVMWTSDGDETLLEPPGEPRTARHLRYDGSLLAGHRNVCWSSMFCSDLAGLFVSPVPLDETLYPDMPWSIMSSDLSTSTGARLPPGFYYAEGENEIAVFRRPDQLTRLPCPTSSPCEAVAISSRGNIVLVNDNSPLPTTHIWTAEHGYRDVATLLAENGVLTQDFVFIGLDMSDDGRVILGHGEIAREPNSFPESHWFRIVWPTSVYETAEPPDGEGGSGGAGGAGEGSGGEAGSGGAEPEVGEPVLGCAAGESPPQARFERLPELPFDDVAGQSASWKVSADGEVVITDYLLDGDTSEPDGHRPVFWKGGVWDWVDAETTGIPTALSCDGSVIVGRKSRLDGFIKKAGTPLVVLLGEEPYWAATPYATSADGTVIAGDLLRNDPDYVTEEARPVVWAPDGEDNYLPTFELRSLRHVRYDGELVGGALNYCYTGLGCPGLSGLFFTGLPLSLPYEETVYEETPWEFISSDFSTATGHVGPPHYSHSSLYEVPIFRPPHDLTVLPCPVSEFCDVVAISSRGNIVLVDDHVWTAEHGYRSLVDLLAADGVRFQDFSFRPDDMSDDGRVIVGSGSLTYENGEHEEGHFRLLVPRDFYD